MDGYFEFILTVGTSVGNAELTACVGVDTEGLIFGWQVTVGKIKTGNEVTAIVGDCMGLATG